MNQANIGAYIAKKRKEKKSDAGTTRRKTRRFKQDNFKMGKRQMHARLQCD